MNDLEDLLRRLVEAEVEFILIGGVAAVLHGSARVTFDVDVVYLRAGENLTRLVTALEDLNPYLRGAPPGLPFRFDAETLKRGLNFTLTTSAGDIDLLGEVPGGGGYEALVDSTIEVELSDITVQCIDLPTLIRLKRAAGRPKDLEALSELEALLDESSDG